MNLCTLVFAGSILLGGQLLSAVAAAPTAKLLEARPIWDQAPHNAFTGLVRFQNRWYCAFRESTTHDFSPGRLRVLVSNDGQEWTSAALITPRPGDFQDQLAKSANGIIDLRDANLSVTARNELMLVGGSQTERSDGTWWHTMMWFSENGRDWSRPVMIGDPNFWIWKVVWRQGKAYAAGYSCRHKDKVRFYRSDDGRKFQVVADNILPSWAPQDVASGETSLVFSENGTCYGLVRRDRQPTEALIGQTKPPYIDWTWKRLNKRLGGPLMIQLPGGRLWVAGRLTDGGRRTSLCWLDPEQGQLHEVLKLPSGGDTGYPGMVYHEGLLWITYYASHEGKSNIYLAKVRIEPSGK